jgi:hypothetical protein
LKVLAILTKSYEVAGMNAEEAGHYAWKEFNTLTTRQIKRIAETKITEEKTNA